jgi:RNA-directed DNA polymerase
MIGNISNRVAAFLGLSVTEVVQMAQKAPKTYRHYRIPKRSGSGMRTIHHPSKQTKSIQYALMYLLEDVLQPHSCATAYIKKPSPLRRNAEIHASREFLLRVDFRDFFPSIRPADLFEVVESARNPKRLTLSNEDKHFLTDALFTYNPLMLPGLPIGAPSSPLISNGVMMNLDFLGL